MIIGAQLIEIAQRQHLVRVILHVDAQPAVVAVGDEMERLPASGGVVDGDRSGADLGVQLRPVDQPRLRGRLVDRRRVVMLDAGDADRVDSVRHRLLGILEVAEAPAVAVLGMALAFALMLVDDIGSDCHFRLFCWSHESHGRSIRAFLRRAHRRTDLLTWSGNAHSHPSGPFTMGRATAAVGAATGLG